MELLRVIRVQHGLADVVAVGRALGFEVLGLFCLKRLELFSSAGMVNRPANGSAPSVAWVSGGQCLGLRHLLLELLVSLAQTKRRELVLVGRQLLRSEALRRLWLRLGRLVRGPVILKVHQVSHDLKAHVHR